MDCRRRHRAPGGPRSHRWPHLLLSTPQEEQNTHRTRHRRHWPCTHRLPTNRIRLTWPKLYAALLPTAHAAKSGFRARWRCKTRRLLSTADAVACYARVACAEHVWRAAATAVATGPVCVWRAEPEYESAAAACADGAVCRRWGQAVFE
jgi:hypothetical protein